MPPNKVQGIKRKGKRFFKVRRNQENRKKRKLQMFYFNLQVGTLKIASAPVLGVYSAPDMVVTS